MDFATDDNSYRSVLGAADFNAVLQTILSERSDKIEWVERSQIKAAEKELGLISAYGFSDSQSVIRNGKWNKADFSVTGRFSTNQSGNRTLLLEMIDLDKAEIAAQTTLNLRASVKEPFKKVLSETSSAVDEIRELMKQSMEKRRQDRGKISVALLFFKNHSLHREPERIEKLFFDAVEHAVSKSQNLRLAQFVRASESVDEAALMLMGLVESDPESWSKVADYYV